MRYPEGIDPAAAERLSQVEPSWIVSSAVYGALVGIGFVVVGIKGRQRWLALCGGSMVVASALYFAATFLS